MRRRKEEEGGGRRRRREGGIRGGRRREEEEVKRRKEEGGEDGLQRCTEHAPCCFTSSASHSGFLNLFFCAIKAAEWKTGFIFVVAITSTCVLEAVWGE